MTWETFYLVCFLVGFLLSLVSFLTQSEHFGGHAGHGQFHGQGHFHGHGHGAHAHAGHGGGMLSKFNFSTLTAFLTVFGGCGYLLRRHTALVALLAIGLAFLMGLGASLLVFWLLAKLAARDYSLRPGDFDMIGVLGRVTSPVRDGGIGELAFSRAGSRQFAAARSEDGSAIPKGVEVVVTRYESGIAYVKKWDELTG